MEKINGITYTNQKETQDIKKVLYELNDGICPITKQYYKLEDMVADHQHKLVKEDCSNWDNGGRGLIRDCLSREGNSLEGKITNLWDSYMKPLHDKITLKEVLLNIIKHIDNPKANRLDECYAYYSEKPKRIKVGKAEYNKVSKYYLELHPKKRVVIKRPVYVTDEWANLVKLTNEYIEDLKIAKIRKQELRRINRENKK